MGGLVSEVSVLQANMSLIGDNMVRVSRYGKLRIINGYVRITKAIKQGDILVNLPVGDRPKNVQWSSSTSFDASNHGKVLGLAISSNGGGIEVNDDSDNPPIGTFPISFQYVVD